MRRCELTIPSIMMRNLSDQELNTSTSLNWHQLMSSTLNNGLNIHHLKLSRQSSVSLPSRREIMPADESPSQRQTTTFMSRHTLRRHPDSLTLCNARDLSTDLTRIFSLGLTHKVYKIIRHQTPNLKLIPTCFVF